MTLTQVRPKLVLLILLYECLSRKSKNSISTVLLECKESIYIHRDEVIEVVQEICKNSLLSRIRRGKTSTRITSRELQKFVDDSRDDIAKTIYYDAYMPLFNTFFGRGDKLDTLVEALKVLREVKKAVLKEFAHHELDLLLSPEKINNPRGYTTKYLSEWWASEYERLFIRGE